MVSSENPMPWSLTAVVAIFDEELLKTRQKIFTPLLYRSVQVYDNDNLINLTLVPKCTVSDRSGRQNGHKLL